MAKTGRTKRPLFIPDRKNIGVSEIMIEFDWHMGMSAEVRKRSVRSLHETAAKSGFGNILEASSKSENPVGIALSAFFLKNANGVPVENLFQSSKVFEHGGPFRDLLDKNVLPRAAKKDARLKNSGRLLKFVFNNKEFPLEPKSLFYDWLYINVLFADQNLDLRERFLASGFDASSDIEFNPEKSINCQARTLALCVSLYENESVRDFVRDPVGFAREFDLYSGAYAPVNPVQSGLF